MNRILAVLCAAALLWGIGTAAPQEKSKGEAGKKTPSAKEITIKGEVVEISCYLAHGETGDKHRECGMACAKSGSPLGILTKDGKLYVSVLPDDHKNGPNAILMDHVAHQVEATGIIREKNGLRGMMITRVAMAADAPPEEKKEQ